MGLVELTESFAWEGRRIAWARAGSGPAVVFCHGTPFSSRVWAPYAEALADRFTVHLWDLPGYGRSSMDPEHRVAADVHAFVGNLGPPIRARLEPALQGLTGPVRTWLNAADARDLVALDPTIRLDYPPENRCSDVLVQNDADPPITAAPGT